MSRIAGLEDLREPFGGLDLSAFINTASYVVFIRGSVYYAKNGISGQVQFSGTDAATVIQAAIDSLPSASAGEIFITRGIYVINDSIILQEYLSLEGEGRATTILRLGNGINKDVLYLPTIAERQSYISIKNLCIDGNKDNNLANGYGIHLRSTWKSTLENLLITKCRESGIFLDGQASPLTSLENRLDNIYVNRCEGSGIVLSFTYDTVITDAFIELCTGAGYTGYSGGNLLIAVHAYANQYGIFIGDTAVDNHLINCHGDTNKRHGIYPLSNRNTLIDCTSFNNGQEGANTYDGIRLTGNDNTIIGCICRDTQGVKTQRDGIQIASDSDDNLVMDNICNDNGRYGIRIDSADCDRNLVKNNRLRNNIAGAFSDLGTNTKLESKTFQFTEPIIGAISVTSPTGVDVDAATEGALTWGQLPVEVQQVVRIKVWAVSTGTPIGAGGQMHLAATFNAGASNAAYNTATKSWTLANFDGEEADYVANDVVHWLIEDGDVGNELLNLLAGDSFEFFALYNVGAAPDGATDAVFRCIEIEYV